MKDDATERETNQVGTAVESAEPNTRDGPSATGSTSAPTASGHAGAATSPSPVTIAAGERFRAPARLVGAQSKIESGRALLLLTALSLLLCCLIFPDVGWWPLAYVALVPWLVAVCTARRAKLVYFTSLLLGLGYFLINIRWLIPVTLPGYFALCIYYAVFFPLAAWPIRHMYQRHGVSVALTAPIVWVATEYLRSIGPLAFPWLLIGHSQYQFLTLIQISDLVGAYGVSFLVVMVSGWITDLLIQPILIWRSDQATRLPLGTLTTLTLVLGALIYGSAQSSRRYFVPGPKISIVQHDFPLYVDLEQAARTSQDSILQGYLELTRQAAETRPDLILLPEAAMYGFINTQFVEATPDDLAEMQRRRYPPTYQDGFLLWLQGHSRRVRDSFQAIADASGVPIVLGSSAMEWKPTAIPQRVDAYNSAFLLMPGEKKPVARYDKIHLVLFGEYVPFRFSHRWLYEWLNGITPWGRMGIEYSLSPGSQYTVFEFPAASQEGQRYRAATPICYEEIIPYITRDFVRGDQSDADRKNIDLLLSISNDGWFLHSAELEQHLAGAVFRAVEHRIAIARSVNTGASAIIHPNGKIHDRVSFPTDRLQALDNLAGSMNLLHEFLLRLDELVELPEKYTPLRQEVGRFVAMDIRKDLQELGNEYLFIAERLERMTVSLGGINPEQRARAVTDLKSQVEHDLDTIERWKSKPHTAPGFRTAQIQCDPRITLYTRWGDWFAQGTVALLGMMLLDWFLRRIWRARTHHRHREVVADA